MWPTKKTKIDTQLAVDNDNVDKRFTQVVSFYEQNSEILIGWVQLLVMLFMGILHIFTSELPLEDVPFDPVPWAISFYVVFTIFRLLKAYNGNLSPAFISLSIIIDISVLMLTIWSTHIVLKQEPTFYLKGDNVIFVFIFIALRALCFQSRWVLMAGITAAIGWAVLVLYALYVTEGSLLTIDYVEYAYSEKIVLSFEINKIILIILITLILSLALKRSRLLLVQSIQRQIATSDLSRFFSPQVAKKITSRKKAFQPGEGQVVEAAILFIDLRNFSKHIHLADPNKAMAVVGEYQKRFVPIIQKHNGCIDKFLGDGILASFGAVQTNETFAADALRAMNDILDTFEKWQEEQGHDIEILKISMAMAVGPVVFGVTGVDNRLEYTIIGDTVNVAAKLEKYTRIEKVPALTTAGSYKQAVVQGFTSDKTFKTLSKRKISAIDETIDLVVIE